MVNSKGKKDKSVVGGGLEVTKWELTSMDYVLLDEGKPTDGGETQEANNLAHDVKKGKRLARKAHNDTPPT